MVKSPKQQKQMNQCRLYLQVLRLSDICNGAGDELLPEATKPSYRTRTNNATTLEWPRQELPPAESWKTWTKVLRQLFLIDKTGQLRSYRLTRHLGYWLKTEDTTWQHVYSPSTNQIYERRRENFYYAYCRTARWGSLFSDDDETASIKTNVPIDSYPVTQDDRLPKGQKYSIYRPQSIFEFQRNIHRRPTTTPRFVLTPRSHIPTESLTEFERPLLQRVVRKISAGELRSSLSAIPTRTMRIGIATASLGGDMCYGWTLYLGPRQIWTGHGTMPQGIGSATTRMCHAAAMYASCYVARSMSNSDWTRSTPCMQVITKNDESKKQLSSVFGSKTWYSPRSKLSPFFPWSENLLELMADRRAWIYAYDQSGDDENHSDIRDLAYVTACEVLNDYMQSDAAIDTPELAVSSSGRAYLLHKNRIIVRDYAYHIRQAVHAPQHQKYIRDKEEWTDETYNSINWHAAGTAFTKRSLNSRIRLTKYIHNWLPLGENMTRIDPEASSICPSCNTIEETTDHIMCCGAETRATKRQEQTNELRERLDEIGTPTDLKNVMVAGISGWMNDNNFQHPTLRRYAQGPLQRLLNIAIKNQNSIGWGQVFRGRLASEFQTYATHQKYGRPTNSYVSQEWSIRLIQRLWDQVESQWTLRNESLHGIDIEDTRSKVRGRITEEVRRLYALKDQLLPKDQRIMLSRSIETVLTWSTAQMKIWTETIRPAINRCLQEAVREDDQSTDLSTSTTPSV